MRIRTVIFLLVFGLGLLPLLTLVALILPKTIDQLDRATELESHALSHIQLARLNTRIRCLKKSLIHSATLPSVTDELSSGIKSTIVPAVLTRWFDDMSQVLHLCLMDIHGRRHLSMMRINDVLVSTDTHDIHQSEGLILSAIKELKQNEVIARLVPPLSENNATAHPSEYDLLMATPVFDARNKMVGALAMRVDLSRFLKNYQSSYWITGSGKLLKGCLTPWKWQDDNSCDPVSFQIPPDPVDHQIVINHSSHAKIAWLPIIFNPQHKALMWIGTVIDQSSTQQWKQFLLINVVVVISVMTLLVFLVASWISTHIDAIRRDLFSGLDRIINREQAILFDWQGPREIRELAADLTTLSSHYAANCEVRNRAQDALRESEDKFRNLTDSALDGIILMDNNGRITYWNKAATQIFGYTADEALDQPIHTLIKLQRDKSELSLIVSPDANNAHRLHQSLEMTAHRKNKKTIPIEVSLSSARINNSWHAIWIVRDISERKKNEQRARRQQAQLLQADKMISLGLLVSGVAHEINNPNSIALLNIPRLARTWKDCLPILDAFHKENGDFSVAGLAYSEMRQQIPRLCTELEESALRIRQIVKDLKDYVRQETSGQKEAVDINKVVRAATRLTANTIRKSGARLEINCQPDLPTVSGHRHRLIQVIINLIQNSCEALDDAMNNRITIETRYNSAENSVEIKVSDTGTGIDPSIIGRVTDPFFTTKKHAGGTGLGLSVSRGIVKEHGGQLLFFSQPDANTVVTVLLPVKEEERTDPDQSTYPEI